MTFKEFKKQHKLNPTSGFCLSYDWDIYCDMAEAAGYDETNNKLYDYYGDHEGYLTANEIELWYEAVNIQDESFEKLERLSAEAFLREYFFDKYEVAESYDDDCYGLVIRLVH